MNSYITKTYARIGLGILIFAIIAFFVYAVSMNQNTSDNTKSLQDFAKSIPADLSELKIEDVKIGDGNEAVTGSALEMNYIGMLRNGTVFDTSLEDVAKEVGIYNAQRPYDSLPFTLGIGQVIQGWDQGIIGMKEGGVRRLAIPANMAYGERAMGSIPANSILIFEATLIKVK